MAGVHDVARAMNINLTTGSGRFTLTQNNAVAWLGDMSWHLRASMWHHPTSATTTLEHDLHRAQFALAGIRNHATAAVFIGDLQQMATDCSP
jgi:hypothetical protein